MRNILAVTATSILLVACGDASNPIAAANGAAGPVVKPGLWEVTTTSHFDLSETVKLCMEDALETDRDYLRADPGEGCVAERKTIPGGLHQITRCEAFGLKSMVDMTFTGDAEAFETKGTITLNQAPPVQSSRKARWLGPCPKGMSDGEAVDAG
ncbi:DUF3617 family protein [Brevundimonas sp.]|uniref:DUF3617 domain-containing protein n=1 Tax=Brevundimonas sp. TaxID=1871086 RepID=UPI0025BB485C|nr:DUF3617 family protein [Brevundimonas sp.]